MSSGLLLRYIPNGFDLASIVLEEVVAELVEVRQRHHGAPQFDL